MKKITLALSALALGIATSAQAYDGVITFNGEVLATSCAIQAGDSAGADATIELPPVSRLALNGAGSRAAETPFSIKVGTEANPCDQANVQAYFHSGGQVNAAGRLSNSGTAQFVDIAVLNSKREDINLNNNDTSEVVAIVDGVAQVDLYGQYYATGIAGSGTVSTAVQYSVVYP